MTDKITRPAIQSAYFSENPTETNKSVTNEKAVME